VNLSGSGVDISIHVTGLPAPAGSRVRIQLFPYNDGALQILPTSLVRGFVDDEGNWSASGLPDFEYVVNAYADGFSFQPQQHRLKPGYPRHEITFDAFQHGAATLRGTLHDDAGKPLARETIQCRSSNVLNPGLGTTADDGAFAIPLST